MVHRINIFLLSILLVVSQVIFMNQALAGAAEKWEIVENVYDTTSQKVNVTARKITQQAANSAVYKVEVGVGSSVLGSSIKALVKGGVAIAAISALVEGVGWIIDQSTKEIKKPKEGQPPNYPYVFKIDGIIYSYSSYTDAAHNYFLKLQMSNSETYSKYVSTTITDQCDFWWSSSYWCNLKVNYKTSDDIPADFRVSVQKSPNPNYVPDQKPQWVPVSDLELGDLALGKSSEKNAPTSPAADVIVSAYDPVSPANPLGGQEVADALDNANPQPDTDPKGGTKPKPNVDTDGDGKPDVYDPNQPDAGQDFTLPAACDWFPTACDFFTVQKQDNKDIKQNQQKQLEQDKTFFEKVSDWFDWSKQESDYPETQEVEIDQTVPEVPNTSYFNWGAYCPFSPGSQTISLENTSAGIDYDLTSWCELASDIRPFVLAAGSLMAFLIASGVIMGRDD